MCIVQARCIHCGLLHSSHEPHVCDDSVLIATIKRIKVCDTSNPIQKRINNV